MSIKKILNLRIIIFLVFGIFLFVVYKLDTNFKKIPKDSQLTYIIQKDDVQTFKSLYNKYSQKIFEIKNDKQQNVIHLICLNNSIKILKYIEGKVDKKYLEQYDSFGNYPLKYAIIKNNLEIVKILISKVNKEQRDKFLGFTPFLVAAFSNRLEILKLLYESGCDKNVKDLRFNCNSLFWAVRKYNIQIIKYLIEELRFDYNETNDDGNTIFFEACSSFTKDSQKCYKTLEYLYLLNNNFIIIPNNEGIYPIMISIYNKNIYSLDFIITKSKDTIFLKDKENYNTIDYLLMTEDEKNIKEITEIIKKYYSNEELLKLLKDSLIIKENSKEYKDYIKLINEQIYN